MDAVTFFKLKEKITIDCTINCDSCIFDDFCLQGKGIHDVKGAIHAIEKWLEKNPEPTYRSVLLKKFPKAFRDIRPCIKAIFGCESIPDGKCYADCDACWDRPYEED